MCAVLCLLHLVLVGRGRQKGVIEVCPEMKKIHLYFKNLESSLT